LLARGTLLTVPWLALALALPGCGSSPPEELAGFRLAMSQQEVVLEARGRGDSACHLTGTRPRVAVCEGTRPGEAYRVVAVDDRTTYIRTELPVDERRPERAVRRFRGRLGEPAWRDRPYASSEYAPAFHTLWLDRDSTRYLAMTCAARGFGPPCSAELARATPAAIEAKLDTILGIRR
jgi:hypothetical protein